MMNQLNTKMNKKDKELYLFYLNDKAKQASAMMQTVKLKSKKDFYHGNYMAFVEMISFTNNIHTEDE